MRILGTPKPEKGTLHQVPFSSLGGGYSQAISRPSTIKMSMQVRQVSMPCELHKLSAIRTLYSFAIFSR